MCGVPVVEGGKKSEGSARLVGGAERRGSYREVDVAIWAAEGHGLSAEEIRERVLRWVRGGGEPARGIPRDRRRAVGPMPATRSLALWRPP